MISEKLRQIFSSSAAPVKPGERILIACSGGPDSVALAANLHELSNELPFRFEIAHVHHALRGKASDGDAAFVKKLAAQFGWPFHLERRPIKISSSGNLEERAREARYQALAQIARRRKCAAILTAHQQDDQVETVFLNLMRGTGPDGMGGIQPHRLTLAGTIPILRPLLDVPRSEIDGYLRRSKIRFRTDRSNRSRRFLRNWLRWDILPQLEKRSPGFKARVSNLAKLIQDERQHWSDAISDLERELLKKQGRGWLLDFRGLLRYSSAVQRRFLRQVFGKNLLTFDAVERLRSWMAAPPTSGRIWQLRKGWIAERLSKSNGSPSPTVFWLGQPQSEPKKVPRTKGKRTT